MSSKDRQLNVVPVKPIRVPTIKLDKRPEYLINKNQAAVKLDGEFKGGQDLIGKENLFDINPPKFRLDSLFDVRAISTHLF